VSLEFVAFRKGVGNDETVWEAPRYEVPFIQVSRANLGNPPPEYHSSDDSAELMSHDLLNECFELFKMVINVLETNVTCKRKFSGLISLSNPKYDLYRMRIDPAVNGSSLSDETERWGHFQDCVVFYLDGSHTVLDMAERHDLPYFDVLVYLAKIRDKSLVEFYSAPHRFSNANY